MTNISYKFREERLKHAKVCHMCVCMCAYVKAGIHTCTGTYLHTCMHTYTHVHIHAHTTHAHTHTHGLANYTLAVGSLNHSTLQGMFRIKEYV